MKNPYFFNTGVIYSGSIYMACSELPFCLRNFTFPIYIARGWIDSLSLCAWNTIRNCPFLSRNMAL